MKSYYGLLGWALGLSLLIAGCESKTDMATKNNPSPQPEKDLPLQKVNLQQLINNAKDGQVLEIPLGRYELDRSLVIARRKNLHIAFTPGTQVRGKDINEAVIVIDGCTRLKLSGVHARHVKPLPEYECHGPVIKMDNSADIRIFNSELNGCGAVGIIATASTLRVTNCHIHSNTWNALYLRSCEAIIIGNVIENNANLIQATNCEEIVFSDNLIRNNGGYWQRKREPGLLQDSQPDLRPVTRDQKD